MVKIKKHTLYILYALKTKISTAKIWLGKKLGLIRSLMIIPYQGFGNEKEIFFLGRVMRDRGIGLSAMEDSKWRNFSRMYKRFMTWEIPFTRVEAVINDIRETAVTDEEGYFKFQIYSEKYSDFKSPHIEIKLTLPDQIIKNQSDVQAINRVVIASEDTEYGIISDIDDTIVPTGATRFWEMFKTTFFRNAHTRIPFPGVAAFYQALAKGTSGAGNNPFFYVSSSPWNLYDFLVEFMQVHKIPYGPLMLRDIGLTREYFIAGSHDEHKLLQVKRIFAVITKIPFILIGDSGQHDAEIYLQVIKDFPGRVKMVYIRDVGTGSRTKLLKLANEIRNHGVEMMLVKNTVEAAKHALYKGWIAENDLWSVAGEKAAEEQEVN
ncbi:MAG TPA: phosphatase domain-containing protein [Mariniphaga sp.]|nr:phosphatase domain-containing protein [Mariniphaga sp.]